MQLPAFHPRNLLSDVERLELVHSWAAAIYLCLDEDVARLIRKFLVYTFAWSQWKFS
jgi:hypothetical protein